MLRELCNVTCLLAALRRVPSNVIFVVVFTRTAYSSLYLLWFAVVLYLLFIRETGLFLCTDVNLLCLEQPINFNVSCILKLTPEEGRSDVGRLGCKLCAV
jgi:hypothetical protein